MDDKKKICEYLLMALQQTRMHEDMVALEYIPGHDVVVAKWKNGSTKTINVFADSGVATIRDIMRAIK